MPYCELADLLQQLGSRNRFYHAFNELVVRHHPSPGSRVQVTIGTNHFGPYYLTQQLLGKLKENTPSRIVWVTSPSESSTPDIDWDNLECVFALSVRFTSCRV